jgi:MoaA/NifB/PqqE/SkfB family radical SAM enzyme
MKYVGIRSFLNKYLNRLEIRGKRTRLSSRPVYLSVEPTLMCNSNCVMCNRNAARKEEVARTRGFLSWSVLRSLSPFFSWSERVLFGGFGEPLLHPEYVPMLAYIKAHGPEVYFFTNGMLLTPEVSEGLLGAGVDQISVSFGGADPETYRRVRGVEMAPVVENLEALTALKKRRGTEKPLLTFNVVAMNSVIKELDSLILLAARLGVSEITMPNLSVQDQSVRKESPWEDLPAARAALCRAAAHAARYKIAFSPPDLVPKRLPCWSFFNSLTIAWDGLVLSCPMERYILGRLPEEDPAAVWNKPQVVAIRKKILAEGIQAVCPNCFCWDNRPEAFLHPHENSRIFAHDLSVPRADERPGG